MPPVQDFILDIHRAREQLDAFNEEAANYGHSHGRSIRSKLNPKGQGEYDLIITLAIHELIPPNLSFLVAEVLGHLRSALDHIIYQLSLDRARSPKDLATTEFPIFKDPSRFSAKYAKGKNRGVPRRGAGLYKIRFVQPAAQAVIKAL